MRAELEAYHAAVVDAMKAQSRVAQPLPVVPGAIVATAAEVPVPVPASVWAPPAPGPNGGAVDPYGYPPSPPGGGNGTRRPADPAAGGNGLRRHPPPPPTGGNGHPPPPLPPNGGQPNGGSPPPPQQPPPPPGIRRNPPDSLDAMPEPLSPTIGWGVLHLFCQPDAGRRRRGGRRRGEGARGRRPPGRDRRPARPQGRRRLHGPRPRPVAAAPASRPSSPPPASTSSTATCRSPSVASTPQGVPDELKQARLYPQLPPEGKRAFCFYPMSKRRGAEQNWFTLPYDERKELMYAHGTSGRKFAGRVLQVVTGSTGIDDWEWGVTLFAVHPDDLKEVVYTMRFDEASADLRRVRAVLHRHGRRRSARCSTRSASAQS